MANRPGLIVGQTDRPGVAEGRLLPSVRDVLRMDPVAEALPEILAGSALLDAPVRWVHVTESLGSASLLNGGELLLTTGAGWPTDPEILTRDVTELVEAGVVGLVLELGSRFTHAPPHLIAECERLGLPLVVLHRVTKFVAITEVVHGRILAEHVTALQARDEIHGLFTGLSLRGSPAGFIVQQLAGVLGAPVVLEDVNHHVLAAETGDLGDEAVLSNWEVRSRQARMDSVSAGAADDAGWVTTPVEARGTRWGYLVALPGEPHPAGREAVLEQGAVALALSRLADRDVDEWTRHSHQSLIETLLGGRYSSATGLRARFEAAGLAVAGRTLIGVVIQGIGERPIARAVWAAMTAARTDRTQALVGVHPDSARERLILGLSVAERGVIDDATVAAFARRLADRLDLDPAALTIAVGSEAGDIAGLLASFEEANSLADGVTSGRSRGPRIVRAEDRPLLTLVRALGDDPRLQFHVERMLRPVIEYDLKNSGDLVDVLTAVVSHPGNRTKAAAASHLSRSVFYQRLAVIEEILGVDLDDGETLSALHVAVVARR